jgi:hypothetical protein
LRTAVPRSPRFSTTAPLVGEPFAAGSSSLVVGARAPPPSAEAPAGAHSSASATNTPANSGRRTASTVACNVFDPLSDAYGVS